jgi:hypothetical protein
VAQKEKSVAWDGAAIGLIVLALVVVFAVGLTRWHKHAIDGSLALPKTLSGGFSRSTAVDAQIASSVSSARKTLGAGTDMALYAKGASGSQTQEQVLVEATRLPGDALLEAGMTYSTVGNAKCSSESSSQGSEAICIRTDNDLTVQVTAGTTKTAAKYADEVYDDIDHKAF